MLNQKQGDVNIPPVRHVAQRPEGKNPYFAERKLLSAVSSTCKASSSSDGNLEAPTCAVKEAVEIV